MGVGSRVRSGILVSVVGLFACGGGGGGGSSNGINDGLGTRGQIANTAIVSSNGTKGSPAVTLDDVGRALAVWMSDGSSSAGLVANQSNSSNVWSTPMPLPQVGAVAGHVMRATADGNNAALLASDQNNTQQQLLRYSGGAWSASALAVPASNLSFFKGNYSDFVLLGDSDNTIALSMFDSASAPVGPANTALYVYRHGVAAGWSSLESDPLEVGRSTHLTSSTSGAATLFWMDADSGSGVTTLHYQVMDLISGSRLGVASFLTGSYGFSCAEPKQLTAATSQTTRRVIAVTHGTASMCDFDLIRVDTFLGSTVPTRMNAPGTTISLHQPIVAMNQNGDALAIWMETPVGQSLSTSLTWSQSLAGGDWSTPAAVITDPSLGQPMPGMLHVALAMNADGQAVLALTTLNGGSQYLVVGRFSFGGGWSNWQAIAAMNSMTAPSVAINAQGQGVVVYGAIPCDRAQGGSFTNCGSGEMYAFRF